MTDPVQIKGDFRRAVQISRNAEETFQEVAQLLGSTKKLGSGHPLTIEWDNLRQVRPDNSARSLLLTGYPIYFPM